MSDRELDTENWCFCDWFFLGSCIADVVINEIIYLLQFAQLLADDNLFGSVFEFSLCNTCKVAINETHTDLN